MEQFRVPRAAQVWEVPVHTPDILAAADAVDAYVEAYRFSRDPRWLRDAVTWARRGLPFVYFWDDPAAAVPGRGEHSGVRGLVDAGLVVRPAGAVERAALRRGDFEAGRVRPELPLAADRHGDHP